jgi:branched-chain amino acid transport system substrate-binding protein
VLHDAYLVKVKEKGDVKEEWDYEEVIKTIPAAEAFNPTVSPDCKMG